MQQREDQLLFQEETRRLAGRIEALELEIDRLTREIDSVRREQGDLAGSGLRAVESRLDIVESRIREVDAEREKDKTEIVERLGSKITEVMKSSKKTASGSAKRSDRYANAYGLEHEVKPGESLSEIASTYGVKLQTIVDANDLENPNHLRAGQKLFIPE